MSSDKKSTYLITGASRGLGRGFAQSFVARPNTIVVAAVRDPSAETSKSLATLPTGEGSVLHIVKLDNVLDADALSAVKHIHNLGISSLDVIIANAAITGAYVPTSEAALGEVKDVMQVNTFAVLALYQAIFNANLFRAGSTFAVLGSAIGSIGGIEQRPYPITAYGLSKAAVHWLTRKIDQENKDVTAFVLDPGFAQTDMGNHGATNAGLVKAFQTVDETITGLVKVIDAATPETHGAKWLTWDESTFPW